MNGGAVGPEIATPCEYATAGSRSTPSHSIPTSDGTQEARNTSRLDSHFRTRPIET